MPEEQIVSRVENIASEKSTGPGSPEVLASPEQSVEVPRTSSELAVEPPPSLEPQASAPTTPAPLPMVKTPEQIRAEQIDQILSEGLEEVFMGLSPQKQTQFRQEGEVTVNKINQLLSTAKVRVQKILELIRKWLAIIPGVNKFFLEQEAKIKTDKIIKLKS